MGETMRAIRQLQAARERTISCPGAASPRGAHEGEVKVRVPLPLVGRGYGVGANPLPGLLG